MRTASAVDAELFRRTCGRFATGIAIATVCGGDGVPYGLTVNSFTSVSCNPPLVLVCIDYRCSYLSQFRSSAHYGINFLRAEQQDLSVRFASMSGDRFAGLPWHRGECGVPILDSCLASLECAVNQTVEAGDHAILIGEVLEAKAYPGEPLLYYGSQYRVLEGEVGPSRSESENSSLLP